jgi:hypothetical protein
METWRHIIDRSASRRVGVLIAPGEDTRVDFEKVPPRLPEGGGIMADAIRWDMKKWEKKGKM